MDRDDLKSTGAELIAAERQRQIDVEGYTPDHDVGHDRGELIDAALCYLTRWTARPPVMEPVTVSWPWDSESWKPSDDPIRNLVRAGALMAAEIDRLRADAT